MQLDYRVLRSNDALSGQTKKTKATAQLWASSPLAIYERTPRSLLTGPNSSAVTDQAQTIVEQTWEVVMDACTLFIPTSVLTKEITICDGFASALAATLLIHCLFAVY